MREGRKVRRVYGQAKEEYDNLFFGLIKTRAEKKKEKQEHTQRNANISLTHHQTAKVAAEADAAKFTAIAAKATAESAQRFAAMTGIQLRGAEATRQLKNVAVAGIVILVIGISAAAFYAIKESRKKTQLEADKLLLNGNINPPINQ